MNEICTDAFELPERSWNALLLTDRIALVTGAGQGNGAAIARGLAAAGAHVVVTDVDGATAQRTTSAIVAGGGRATASMLDVTDPAACERVAADLRRDVGLVSILVNNAGVGAAISIDSPDLRAVWNNVIDVNLHGPFNVTMAFLPALRETKGCVINLASIASFTTAGAPIAYPTSKGGIRMFTQTLARELGKDGVRVNAIAPGVIETPMTAKTLSDPDKLAYRLRRIALGRIGTSDDLVGPVVFLASAMAEYVTGTTLVVDGGFMA